MANFLVLNGPNLNLLGTREPSHYGTESLDQIEASLRQLAKQDGAHLAFEQSNAEHLIVDRIHAAATDGTNFIIINPAAFTHTSVAIRDALLAVAIPFIEVHLSNVYKREAFRHKSYFSDVALGVISGLGSVGYEAAFMAGLRYLKSGDKS